MDLFYTNETLFININEEINDRFMNQLRKQVFKIIDDYEIDNITLNTKNNLSNQKILEPIFIEYSKLHNRNIKFM